MSRRHHRLLLCLAVFLLTSSTGASWAAAKRTPSLLTPPAVSGQTLVGQTLSSSTGKWGGSVTSYAYQWLRCDGAGSCSPLAGATASTYGLSTADAGSNLRSSVTARNRYGSTTATSNATATVVSASALPANTALPQASGTPQTGLTLSGTNGTWSGSPTSYAYQWKRCDATGAGCASIAGAAAHSYLVGSADVGLTLRVAVSATNAVGTSTATSAATSLVAPAAIVTPPSNSAPPQVTGLAQTGQTLTTSTGSWSGAPTVFAYGWSRCDAAGASCATLVGATGQTYAAVAADVGKTLRASVSATNAGGTTVAVSAPTPLVAAAPAAANGRFGVATGGNVQNLSATDLARYLDGLKASRAGWVRIDINWHVIQYAGATSYNWAPFDNVVNAARARGLAVLGGILYTPPWARAAGTTPSYPPTNLADYTAFAKAAAQHFGALGVHAYEIWNEPNIVNFWAPGPDPARYTQMLKLAYTAIKSVDPSATVVSAGLSPYGSYTNADAQHMNPISFLERMYANGAAGSMDAVGWHPYNYPYGLAFAGWSAWSQMAQTSPSARSVMSANGDAGKQIWATEFGEPTGTSTRAVSEAVQAQFITDSYTALKGWSWAGPAFLYSYYDAGTDPTNIEHNFGIIRNDWSLKPSYSAYAAAATAG
jgi:polysaccharide biosynthesis protein PslG